MLITLMTMQVEIPEGTGIERTSRIKAEKIRELEEKIRMKAEVKCEQRIYVTLSPMGSHCGHDFEEMAGFSQAVNKEVSAKIHELVREGITCAPTVKHCLDYYVYDVLFVDKPKPDKNCRAFFPTEVDIRNHVQAALRRDRFSSLDQENAASLIDKCRKEEPGSKFFYRPYHKKNVGSSYRQSTDDVQEELQQECEETLLFCYQSPFMKAMMEKYGRSVSCLDATNKTTSYALPLFLIVVKTPHGYLTVGAFVTQFETGTCISEALKVFREWNPDFSPEYWMIDYSQAEINALNECFPESKVVLCDFHREQAWDRWLKRTDSCVQSKDAVLTCLRKIANSSSEEEMELHISDLKSSPHWMNCKLRSYIECQWLAVKEMWVRAYRLDFNVVITTNNGTEAQNKVLKHKYLNSNQGKKKSLTTLISALVKKFLPDRQQDYNRRVMRSSSSYRAYSGNIPDYLHNRPAAFIKHVMQRMNTALEYEEGDVDATGTPGQYQVRSQSSGWHTVDMSQPQCTCMDFRVTKFPCKHFCAVFRLGDTSFLQLPESYLNGPCVAATGMPNSDAQEMRLGHIEAEPAPHEVTTVLSIPPSSSSQLKVKRALGRSLTEKFNSLLYYCTDPSALDNANKRLEEACAIISESVPSCSGLTVRGSPTKGCSGQRPQSLPRKTARSAGNPLPLGTANKEHWRTRGRVGKHAGDMRKTLNVNPLLSTHM